MDKRPVYRYVCVDCGSILKVYVPIRSTRKTELLHCTDCGSTFLEACGGDKERDESKLRPRRRRYVKKGAKRARNERDWGSNG